MSESLSEEEKRLLLFDETPEYLAMSRDEQKKYFKEAVKKINPEQMKRRIEIKIKNQGRAVTEFKMMKNMQTMKENKMDKVLNQRNKSDDKKVVNNNNNNNNNKNKVLNLPDKKKVNTGGKYDNKKLASGFIEGKAGASKRKSTRKNLKNAELLNFIEESDNIKQKKDEEEEEEEEWKKNAREQQKIRESNKKLKAATKNLKRTYYGYHNLNKKNDKDIETSNTFNKNKSFDKNSLFDNANTHGKRSIINPPLQKKELELQLDTPGVVNFSSLLSDMQRNSTEQPITSNINFRRLGGMQTSDTPTIVMTNTDIIKVFRWHEERLNTYKGALNISKQKFEEVDNYIKFLEKRIWKLENDTVYTDYNTLVIRDNCIRKIQSTWRWYKFRRSYNAILLQRWFRYKKNVIEVSDDVKKFFEDMKLLREETKTMEGYLQSLNGSKALPLNKLKEIKNTMKQRLNRVKNMI
tara:strand:- start:2039 stop:3433 length:1395 start_codon:yes stop_codon:yes gene_type:complete